MNGFLQIWQAVFLVGVLHIGGQHITQTEVAGNKIYEKPVLVPRHKSTWKRSYQ
jgi:hypothetical protein